jgi:hypothetical protein
MRAFAARRTGLFVFKAIALGIISKSDVVNTASTGPLHRARTALPPFAMGIGCCVLATRLAVADTAPWLNKVRPTEELVLATSADDPALRKRLLALSPAVCPDEAKRVAHCAYTTGRELAREWRVVWMPGVQNFLVNIGARKGGLCFQWASELLIRLNALRLQTLDLHWAESYLGTAAEHNVIVVTAKGQPFDKGLLLDNWRYEGRLTYCRVTMDPEYRWSENPAELARRLKVNSTPIPQSGLTNGEMRRLIPR